MTTTTVTSGMTLPGYTITSGNGVDVLSGGTIATAVVQPGSVTTNPAGGTISPSAGLIIEVGGIDQAGTVQLGASELMLGSATGDIVAGLQYVSAATATVMNETVVSGGTVDLFLKGVVGTALTVAGGTLNISGNAVASNTTLSGGTLSLQSPKASLTGGLILQGNANTIDVTASQSTSAGVFQFEGAVISGFTTGDVIDDTALVSGAAISSTSSTSGGIETVNVTNGGTAVETFVFTAGTTAKVVADANGFVELVACYCPGTLIRTVAGEVPVGELRVGDEVVTVSGDAAPVRWIGRRSYGRRTLAGRAHLQPVRIKAGALADATPGRDLLISPLHAMLIDGVLVPAHCLVNGTSVVREEGLTEVHYVHIELDRHDAVWAEGAASETFVDDDGRFLFQGSDGDAAAPRALPSYCAPRVEDGFALEAIRARVNARSALPAAA